MIAIIILCKIAKKKKKKKKERKLLGRVARSMVSAKHWLSGIKTYRLS